MEWRVLTKYDHWDNIIAQFEHLDVFYTKEYIELYSNHLDDVPEAFYYKDGDTRIFYPYLKRNIDFGENRYLDIVSIGFGGPYVEGDINKVTKYSRVFSEYCQQNNVITETVRFHPLYGNAHILKHDADMDIEYIRLTAAVDLQPSMEEIRNRYHRDKRYRLRKSNDLNIEIVDSNSQDQIQIFRELYYETMDRKRSESNYYYPCSFFEGLMQETALCKPRLLLAKLDDQFVAGVLLLIGKKYAHYHLSASTNKALRLGVNVRLMDYMIQYAKENGTRILHLGPGMKEYDSLYTYKSYFSNMAPFQYYIGKKVHNPTVYEQLTHEMNKEKVLETTFFPLYRAKSVTPS